MSFVSGAAGRQVFTDAITLEDNAFHSPGEGIPFDYEGMPRKRVTLIDKGVFKGAVYDRETAARWGQECTGHALPQPNSIGPIPSNLVLAAGNDSYEDILAGTERGVLVTQFHYVNLIDPRTLLLTGMTRNGTFLIEGGRIKRPLKNLRFTESVVQALNRVDGVSRDAVLASGFFGGSVVVPAMRIRDFNFTSATAF